MQIDKKEWFLVWFSSSLSACLGVIIIQDNFFGLLGNNDVALLIKSLLYGGFIILIAWVVFVMIESRKYEKENKKIIEKPYPSPIK